MTRGRRFPFGQAPGAVTARAVLDVTAPLPAVEPTRRLPLPAEAAPQRIESPPRVARLTMPLDPRAPRRPALPFVPVMRSTPILREMPPTGRREAPPRAREAPPRSRAYRWLWGALIVVGLLLYVAALAAIVAPLPGRPR